MSSYRCVRTPELLTETEIPAACVERFTLCVPLVAVPKCAENARCSGVAEVCTVASAAVPTWAPASSSSTTRPSRTVIGALYFSSDSAASGPNPAGSEADPYFAGNIRRTARIVAAGVAGCQTSQSA